MSKEMKSMALVREVWRIAMPQQLPREFDRDAQHSGGDGEEAAPE